jgi:hypothetical protein
VSAGNLFVVNGANDTIGEYTTSGATVNPALIPGLSGLIDIAVVSASVPDGSSTWTLPARPDGYVQPKACVTSVGLTRSIRLRSGQADSRFEQRILSHEVHHCFGPLELWFGHGR